MTKILFLQGSNCQTPACTSTVFIHPDGTPGNCCKMTHKQQVSSTLTRAQNNTSANRLGERGCISCRVAPRNGGAILCQICYDDAISTGPVLIEVSEYHESYKSGTPMRVSFANDEAYGRQLNRNLKNLGSTKQSVPKSEQCIRSSTPRRA